MSYLVEVNTLFLASTREEAEEVLDAVMDAELAVVCPEDASRLVVCSHCHGAQVNPAEERIKELDTKEERVKEEVWAPGAPCAMCAGTEYPGQEMPCVREHTSGATIHPDGDWLTGEDRRTYALLVKVRETLARDGAEAVQALLGERLASLEEFKQN